ncbi:outer membrane protein assembly factor BamB family protein [Halorientalis salina]|uniref:outer membrane protein assembly factor BamB family protein n=1 Tax=Halorientalis salina TaxID=2932266 RepID=UPI0010ACACEE|nr:PQQ-binding-like beta-propeller repeat protein [Halorientalis salina]
MSSLGQRRVGLGDVDPTGSRHLGRRSAVSIHDDRIVVGTAAGEVVAFDADLTEQWCDPGRDSAGSLVSISTHNGNILVGERGPRGAVRCHDGSTGELQWRYETAEDIGNPQKETRFFLPFVADIVTDGERGYVTARRYERRDGERRFRSFVYAFEPDGEVAWRYETDASPISLDVRDDRLAVAFNRCPGAHQCGLVVLDADAGTERLTWDPGTAGQRRVGDVSLLDDGVALASHGDYHGYRLDDRGRECWRVPLATPETVDGERVYAYPNHVHTTESGIAFVTGNTYPEEGRETEARHPNEHTAVGVTPGGERTWRESVGGFATGIGTNGDLLVVPGAQHFRDRDADAHGFCVFGVADGPVSSADTEGVVAAAALGDEFVAAVEEPVAYHDEHERRGAYRLHVEELQ